VVLATLIVAATLIIVFMRRRKLNMNTSLMVLPLLFVLFASGCVKHHVVPLNQRIAPSHPFSRQQALDRLESMSKGLKAFQGNVNLSGTTPSLKKANTIIEPPFAINGQLFMKGPKIFLKGSKGFGLFEMVSDGNQYEIYATAKDELYVGGMEEGPAYKKFLHLGETENQLISIRPGKIQEALMIDILPLFQNPSIKAFGSVETIMEPDAARRCFVLQFWDISENQEPRVVQMYYFDLGTDNVDLWRRKTYTRTGAEETDARYSGYKAVTLASMRYPSKVDVHFFNTDTWVKIELDPQDINFNERDHETGERKEVSDQRFDFGRHADAKKVFKFEPVDSARTVTQQQ
jgi:hypothetical protein